VTRKVGGGGLFNGMGLVVIFSSLGAGLAAQVAAARVLYSMGRENVLPRKVFGYLQPKTNNPIFNILLVSVITWTGAMLLGLEHAGELLNFGAFLGFMGVNLAAIRQCYFLAEKTKRNVFTDVLPPLLGFLFCLGIWLSLPTPAKIVGGVWFLLGLVYHAIRSRGFTVQPEVIDFEK
jgi:putrescine importer